jgi:hypothetical protein
MKIMPNLLGLILFLLPQPASAGQDNPDAYVVDPIIENTSAWSVVLDQALIASVLPQSRVKAEPDIKSMNCILLDHYAFRCEIKIDGQKSTLVRVWTPYHRVWKQIQ